MASGFVRGWSMVASAGGDRRFGQPHDLLVLPFTDMPCMRRVYKTIRRHYTGQQPGTKSARRPTDKMRVNRGFCSPIGLHTVSCDRSSRVMPRGVFFYHLGVGEGRLFPGQTDPSASCPARPRPAPPSRRAPPRPDPPLHEWGLQGQLTLGPLVRSHGRRVAAFSMINRLSTACQSPGVFPV